MNSRDVKVYPSKSRTDAHDRAARFAGELNTTALAKAAAGRNAFVVSGNTVEGGMLLVGTIFMRGYLFTTKAESTLEVGKDNDTLACWQIEVGSDGTSIGTEALLDGGDTSADIDSTYNGLSLVYVARDDFRESVTTDGKNIVTLPVAIMTQSGWKTFDYGYMTHAELDRLQTNIREGMDYSIAIDGEEKVNVDTDITTVNNDLTVKNDLTVEKHIYVDELYVHIGEGEFAKLDATTDLEKPVSEAQREAITDVQTNLDTHTGNTSNPHAVTKSDIGLENVDNTSDANKPISTEQKAALGLIASNYTIKDLGMRIHSKVPFDERFEAKTWTGLTSFIGDFIWTDGTSIYYSGTTPEQYKLDVGTGTWSIKTWHGLTIRFGSYIWTDGTYIYYSAGSNQYKLDVGTDTWSLKTWTGFTDFYGDNIWTDGTSIYYSGGSGHYKLDVGTSTWSIKTWNGFTDFYGRCIWTDGNNVYCSGGSNQYKLDVGTSTWSIKTWNGFTDFTGVNIWTDGTYIYYSDGSNQYKLDVGTSTWSLKTWTGFTDFYGDNIWTDGTYIYYSDGTTQYKFIPKRFAEDALSTTQTAVEEVKNNYTPKNNIVWQGAATETDGIELNLQILSTGTYLITKITGGTSINIQDVSVPDHVMSATAFIANVIGDAIRVFTIGGVTDEIYSYQNGLACSVDAGGGDLAIIRLN